MVARRVRAREPRRTRGTAEVITPPSLVEVLRARWEPVVPLFHPSADGREAQR